MLKKIIKDIFDAVADFDKENEKENNLLREEIEKQREVIDRQNAEIERLKGVIKSLVS